MAWKALRLQGNQLSRMENLQGNFRIREVGVTVDFPNRNSTLMGNLQGLCYPICFWFQKSKSIQVMWVKQQIQQWTISQITIFIGGMFTIPGHGCFMTLLYHILPTWFHHEKPETGALLPVRSTCRIIAWYLWRACEPSSFSRRRNASRTSEDNGWWFFSVYHGPFPLSHNQHGRDSSTIGLTWSSRCDPGFWMDFGWNSWALTSLREVLLASGNQLRNLDKQLGLLSRRRIGPKNSDGELMVSRFEWSLTNLTWNRTNRTFRWNQATTQSCIIWSNVHDFLCVFLTCNTSQSQDLEHSHTGWLPLFGLWIELGYPRQEVSPKEESSLALFGTYSIELG